MLSRARRIATFVLSLAAPLIIAGCLFSTPKSVTASTIALEPLGPTFSQPLLVASTPAHPDTLFVVEKIGRIQVVRDDALQPEPLLDVRQLVSSRSEQGLLGLAFHPDFGQNGLFFVNYTDRSGTTQVVRYRVMSDRLIADPSSATTILSIPQPASNHNGGMLAFGPDGYLYIGTGDGGGGGDPYGNAQNTSTLLGKLLRIDVDNGTPYVIPATNPFAGNASYRPEIWALGLRNPWRFSFDRVTGDLYIADVGQNAWEEVNLQLAGTPGGQNYGWNKMEGTHCYPAQATCSTDGLTLPVIEYGHRETRGCSVTGGYVYRGALIPELVGKYVFGDYCTGEIWAAEAGDSGGLWSFTTLAHSGARISSFGEDVAGELYVTDLSKGRVYRIVPAK